MKKKVLVLGDSHVRAFNYLKIPNIDFLVGAVGGATASGLANPDANTQANRKFLYWVDYFKSELVIVQLGEVDCGFVIWYRVKKYDENPANMINLAVSNYIQFIERIKNRDHVRKIIILSAPLPTILDNRDLIGTIGARKEITASLYHRVSMTIYFNLCIQKNVENHDFIQYVNLDLDLISEFGTVGEKYLNPDPKNHHYFVKNYVELLKNRLGNLLNHG